MTTEGDETSTVRGLASAAAVGVGWNYAAFALNKGLVFLATLILARLLVPEDFGLLALGLVVMQFLDRIAEFGVGQAVIFRQEDPERTANVAFILNMTLSAAMSLAAFCAAPLVGVAFQEPRVTPVIRVLAFAPLLYGLRNVPAARLSKSLDFRRRLLPEVGRAATRGTVAIVLAMMGFGVWSLVWGHLAGAAVCTALYWWVTGWRPRLEFDWAIARLLAGYGVQIVLVGLLTNLIRDVDYFVVGRRLGAAALGYYTIALRLPELLVLGFCRVVSRSLFPAFSRLQKDWVLLRVGFLASLRYIAMISVPVSLGLVLVARESVLLFYGDRWAPVIAVTRLLAVYAMFMSMSFNTGDVYKAIGRPMILNQIGLSRLVVAAPLLWLAAGYDIVMVATAQLLIGCTWMCLRLAIACRVIKIRPLEVLREFRPAGLSGAAMLVGTGAVSLALPPERLILRLCILVLVGACVYTATLWWVDPAMLRRAWAVLRRRR
jgi:O-antigen/teichoic acid export membrane protein